MDITPVVPKHTGSKLVAPKQEDFGPSILRHKDCTLAALRHMDFGPTTLGQKDYVPISLGHQDFGLVVARLVSGLVLAAVDPIDMYIRDATARVGSAAIRVDFAVTKAVRGVVEVGLAKTQAMRSVEHTSSIATWFAITVARVAPGVVVVVLVVV